MWILGTMPSTVNLSWSLVTGRIFSNWPGLHRRPDSLFSTAVGHGRPNAATSDSLLYQCGSGFYLSSLLCMRLLLT
jgi:hypothetical protein